MSVIHYEKDLNLAFGRASIPIYIVSIITHLTKKSSISTILHANTPIMLISSLAYALSVDHDESWRDVAGDADKLIGSCSRGEAASYFGTLVSCKSKAFHTLTGLSIKVKMLAFVTLKAICGIFPSIYFQASIQGCASSFHNPSSFASNASLVITTVDTLASAWFTYSV